MCSPVRRALLAALALLSPRATQAGVGGSVVFLSPCSASSVYQRWAWPASGAGTLDIAGDAAPLWRTTFSLSTGTGINSVTPSAGARLFTAGRGSALALAFTGGSPTSGALALTSAAYAGLCVAVAAPGAAVAGAALALAPCDGSAAQRFAFASGALRHAASGLCADAGSRSKACEPGAPGADLPFCNASLPLPARVADLVARLTVDEKAGMLATASAGAPLLGVPPVQWWQESLHGVANNVGTAFDAPTPFATSFPQPITSSAAFNRSLWRATGAAIATEARAFANAGHSGLTMWAPNINLARDARWGRIQETPGEDPFLSGAYAEQYMRGMQEGEDPRYIKVSACCKHFVAYSLESWEGMDRHHFNAVVSDEDLAEFYLPAFQACVERGRASQMMCSYNSVNGVPACASSFFMTDVARGEWAFDGSITSDCAAVADIMLTHNYTNSTVATLGATLPAGMDIGCDTLLVQPGAVAAALASGALPAAALDAAVSHQLRVRFRLGEFDAAAGQPYTRIGADAVCSPAHRALARDSARQALVLLENPRGALPLARAATASVAVVGPGGNSTRIINGGINYAGIPCGGAATSVSAALAAAGVDVRVAAGCADVACANTSGFAAAAAAAAADATVAVLALDETGENEGLDRTSLAPPGRQADLVVAACGAARGPCVLVIMSGGGVDVGAAARAAATGGIIAAGFLGGDGAPALVDTLFGDSAPAGRLSQTWYAADFVDAVSMFEMGVRPGPSAFPPGTTPGRTHMFYTGTPAWPFGFGRSYTTWALAVDGPAAVSLAGAAAHVAGRRFGGVYAPLDAPVAAKYRVNVTNTGAVDSDYSVLGFLEPPGAGQNGVPREVLFGFDRVRVRAGETVSVWLGVGARDLTRVARDARGALVRAPVPGSWRVRVGVGADEAVAVDFVAA